MHLLGDVPHEGDQLTGDGNDDVSIFSSCGQFTIARTESDLGLPGDVTDPDWNMFLPKLDFSTDLCLVSIGPRGLDQIASCMAVAAFGNGSQPGALTGGVLRRYETEETHQLTWIIEAGQIAEFRDNGYGIDEADSTHGLKRIDDWREVPAFNLLFEHELKAFDPMGAFGNGIDVLLEDDLLRGRGHDPIGKPAQMGFSPVGSALIANAVPQQKRLESLPGGLLIEHGILSGAGQIAYCLIIDIGYVDRREIPGAIELRQAHGIAAVGFDSITWFFRY